MTRFRVAVTVVVDVEAADVWDAQSDAVKVARCALAGTTGLVSLESTVIGRDNGPRGDAYPEIGVKGSWRDDWRRSREGQPSTPLARPAVPPPGGSGVSS